MSNYFEEHYKKLVGQKIVGLVKDPSTGYEETGEGVFYGLRLSNGLTAWIQRDIEGNGPGFLNIEKV